MTLQEAQRIYEKGGSVKVDGDRRLIYAKPNTEIRKVILAPFW